MSQAKLKNVEDIYALTGMQQLMLVHALHASNSEILQEQLVCSVEGQLDAETLKRAWKSVVSRHPALRTCFLWEGLQKPLQVVRQQVEVPWEELDWRGMAGDEQLRRIDGWLEADRKAPLELTRAPLMRMCLIRLDNDRWRFFWRAHHLRFDGWSLAFVLGEVLAQYLALDRAQKLQLPPAPPFRDYLRWLERQDAAQAAAFWRRQLGDFVQPTPLTFSAPRCESPAEDAASPKPEVYGDERLRLSAAATAALNSWARRRQLTPAVLVQAAWALLLARSSRHNDIVLGATVSGRPADLAGVEAMVGPFINNVPLRVRIDPDQALSAWLQTLQKQMADLAPYQHTPLVEVEAQSGIPPGRRLFESLVVFENYPIAENCRKLDAPFEIHDLQATIKTIYPLTLAATPGDELLLEIRYLRQRFAAAAMRRLLSELQTLLAAFPEGAERTVGEFGNLEGLIDVAADGAQGAGDRVRPLGSREFVSPRNELEARLAAIWSELLGFDGVGVHDNFFELGGDSMLAVRLMAEVERACGRKLPLAWLFQDATIEHLAQVLSGAEQGDGTSSLVPIRAHARGMKQPLFCVHPAGGTVFCYRELARHLDAQRPIYGLQARGIDGCQPPHTRIEDMAADYIAAMRSVQPAGPYLLAGWSLGGILAFEMARQLAAAGQQTALLAVIDAGMVSPDESFDEDDFLPVLLEMFPDEYRPSREELQGLRPAEQLDFFRRRAQRAGVVLGGDSPVQDQHVFQAFQANLNALLEYRPRPYPGRLTLFRAADGVTALHRAPQLGWRPWAGGGIDEHVISGEHVHLFREPHIQAVAELLDACLRQVEHD
ncbi:MAG TPA: alpha/beta fold hydrolase [Pirellulales bacterium]|nr:alpha/beta fold hydrolase [Pirellulales bacterium]